MFRAARQPTPGDDATLAMDMESFRARQVADMARYEDADGDEVEPAGASTAAGGQDADDGGEEGWRNKEGERLADFGVDEVVDFYDEDHVPLAELVKRRKAEKAR